MSEQSGGAFVDDLFGQVLGALAPDDSAEAGGSEASAEGAPGVPAAGAPAGDAGPGDAARGTVEAASVGVPPDPNLGADAPATGGDGAAAASADGGGEAAADGAADAGPAGGDREPAGTVDYATVQSDLTGLTQQFEERTLQGFQQEALGTVQDEFPRYFEALRKHPRMLVGTEVPSLQGEGTETLRDAADAREWQEAVKQLLTDEVQERATAKMEESKGILDTVHQSIELFTKNPDMVPGTRQFDRQLADRFAALVKPYELRVEGKLHGYTIPVQPLVEQLRATLAAERTAAAPPAQPAPVRPAAAQRGAPAAQEDPPQRGIGTKAGASSEEPEGFETLFGTLGLPNLKI